MPLYGLCDLYFEYFEKLEIQEIENDDEVQVDDEALDEEVSDDDEVLENGKIFILTLRS